MATSDLLPPAAHYEVELLFSDHRSFDFARIAEHLSDLPAEMAPTLVDDGEAIAISLRDASAHWIIRPAALDGDAIDAAISQTWHWGDGRALALNAKAALRIVDHGSRFEYKERLRRIRLVVTSVARVTNPVAIHWTESQQIGDPQELLRAVEENWADPVLFAVNVRLFRIDPEPGDAFGMTSFVMDTFGLAPLGLPDVQCHFRQLDPTVVGPVLYDVAQTLFERGPVILSGSKVAGPEGESWTAQFEDSIADPPRGVIDLNPGRTFAAGERSGASC